MKFTEDELFLIFKSVLINLKAKLGLIKRLLMSSYCGHFKFYFYPSWFKFNKEGKNNVLSANKQSNNLHTAVSVAFSYLLQCKVKTDGKLFLFISK